MARWMTRLCARQVALRRACVCRAAALGCSAACGARRLGNLAAARSQANTPAWRSLLVVTAQVATHTGPLPLRFLDIGGVDGLSDAGIAALLALCPNLRVLHAASSKLGSASLAALAGRQQAATAASAAAEAPDQGRQRSPRQRQPSSRGSGCAAAAAEELAGLRLSPGHPAQATHAATAAAASAEAEAAAAPQAACPLLERLDLSGCRRVKGSALRRALRCLPRLADLRLNACAGLSSVLDPLLDWMPAGAGGCCSAATAGSAAAAASGKAAVAAALLGGLTRLEATDADDLSAAHAAALLRCCTSLRRLALSGKQLAGERADRAKYPAAAAGSSGGSGDGTGTPSPSLVHLEVGWGSGGTLLLHLASRHGRHLASLVVHPGAAVSDDLLRSLTASCRHLARLSLKCANVSDAGGGWPSCGAVRFMPRRAWHSMFAGALLLFCLLVAPLPAAGVAAVLQGCTQLTSLQLLGCTGPLTDALGASLRSGGGGAQRAPFRLRELQVAWGAGQLTNAGLATLLHPSCAALQVLVLKGCSRLTDGAWAAVGQQAGTLECLQLEHCGALAAQAKRGAGSGSSSSCHEPMTASAALGALAACSRLLALTLRGCTPPWSSAQVARLQEACTALQSLDLEVE